MKETHITKIKRRIDPVEQLASRVAVQRVLRETLQARVAEVRAVEVCQWSKTVSSAPYLKQYAQEKK